MPHNGYLRFAHHIIYSFDPIEDAGIPLEFRPFPVEFTLKNVHLSFGEGQSSAAIAKYIDDVIEYSKTTEIPGYGPICSVKKHI